VRTLALPRTEEAGTWRQIINIFVANENKCWLAPVNIDGVLLMLAVKTEAGKAIVNKKCVHSVTVEPLSQALVPCCCFMAKGHNSKFFRK
jgi:hypothetical protein